MIKKIYTLTVSDFQIVEMEDGKKIGITDTIIEEEKNQHQDKLQNIQIDRNIIDDSSPGRGEKFEDLIHILNFEETPEGKFFMRLNDGNRKEISLIELKTLLSLASK